MNVKTYRIMLAFLTGLIFFSCSNETQTEIKNASPVNAEKPAPEPERYDEILPESIEWLTNDTDPVFSSEKAKKGGVFRLAILSFPMTFRVVGPDANGSFRGAILDNQLSLINIHPNTGNILPELATHWAFDRDKKTMYFKLDKDARWSDGTPVTARDYTYTLEFMRSEHIISPWYNHYYTKEIEKVIVYDNHTIGVRSTKAMPDLHMRIGIGPVPRHFFDPLDNTFVETFNWAVVPNTGAYQISDFKKGKFIKFKRKKDWWAKNKRFFRNRFNADTVTFDVIRDVNLQWEHFKKGKLDVFGLTMPKYWHEKSKTAIFEKGYARKIWFFNDRERSARGMWLNQDKEVFKDRRVCQAFAHAMNIEKVMSQVLRNDYFRLPQAFFGYGDYTNPDIRPRTYDIEKVNRLMTDAGWDRGGDGIWARAGQRFSVKVTYYVDEHTPRLVVLKEDARKAGIELLLDRQDSTAAFKKIQEKKHDVAWMAWTTNLRPTYWQGWHSDNAHKPQTNNITNTDDPDLDRLIEIYRASLDAAERMELSRKIQVLIHETGAFVPTFMIPYIRQGYWQWVQLPEFHGTRRSDTLFDPFNSTSGGLFWIDRDVREKTLAAKKADTPLTPVVIKNERFRVK